MWFCSVLFFLKCISTEHSFDKNVYFNNRNWSEMGREKRGRERERGKRRIKLRKKKEKKHIRKLNKHYTPTNGPE
jgi:hypothetical protein